MLAYSFNAIRKMIQELPSFFLINELHTTFMLVIDHVIKTSFIISLFYKLDFSTIDKERIKSYITKG